MISRTEAIELIETGLIGSLPSGIKGVVDDSLTLSYDWGWVFFWNSQQFIETGDDKHELWGNNPYRVNKNTGEGVQSHPKTDIEAS